MRKLLFGWPRSLAFLKHSCCLFGLAKGRHVQCWGGTMASVHWLSQFVEQGWDLEQEKDLHETYSLWTRTNPQISFSLAGAGGQKVGQGSGPVFTRSLDFNRLCWAQKSKGRMFWCTAVNTVCFVFWKGHFDKCFYIAKITLLRMFFFLLSFSQYILFPYLFKNIYLNMIYLFIFDCAGS